MRKIIFLFCINLLLLGSSYSQDTLSIWSPKTVYGEWFMLDYDGLTDDLYFRSDGIYLVYNEMDVVYYSNSYNPDTTRKSTLIYDNGMVTARTELGRWIFNPETKQIILREREFLKPDSHFSNVFGKEEELVINVKRLSKDVFTMCPENKDYCLSYRDLKKVPFPPGVSYVRGSYCKNSTGNGSKIDSVSLSGRQMSLTLDYTLPNIEDSIIFKNLKGELIGSVTGQNGLSGSAQFALSGVTKLNYEIVSDGAWKMKLDVK